MQEFLGTDIGLQIIQDKLGNNTSKLREIIKRL